MSKRAASLVQADYDRAVTALVKAGLKPEIVFDITANKVIVSAAAETKATQSKWKDSVPQRV